MTMDQQPPPREEPPRESQQPQGWQQPPQQWQQPPQQSGGWEQSTYAASPARPGAVTFAGVFLIVMGVLFLLFAALAFVGGAALEGMFGAETGGAFAGIFTFFALILLAFAIAQLAGGIGALRGRNWGRITGIVVSVIILIFLVLGLPAAMTGQVDPSSLVFNLVLIVLYGLTVWALAKAGPYFAYRR